MTARAWVVELPAGLKMLSLNGRYHWAERNRRNEGLKMAAWASTTRARIPRLERAEIVVEYQPPDRRARDADNIALAAKACIDGAVKAGVLADDNSGHLARVSYRIGAVHPRGRLVLHITEVLTEEATR